MITYSILDWSHENPDWYPVDPQTRASEDTGFIVEWHTNRTAVTYGKRGTIYHATTGKYLTDVRYYSLNEQGCPYMDMRTHTSYQSLAHLVEAYVMAFESDIYTTQQTIELDELYGL